MSKKWWLISAGALWMVGLIVSTSPVLHFISSSGLFGHADSPATPASAFAEISQNQIARPAGAHTASAFVTMADNFATAPEIIPAFVLESPSVHIPAPDLNAKAALVMDAYTGKVLFATHATSALPIASISKLMTTLLVLKYIPMDTIITIPQDAMDTYGNYGDLRVGEQITARSLLNLMLVVSSNNAAVTFADYVSAATKTPFPDLMNKEAQNMGLYAAYFKEPTGLSAHNAASAWDVARMANAAFANPLVKSFISMPTATVYSANRTIVHNLVNTDEIIGRDGIIGGKTGFTDEAGQCLVALVHNKAENKNFIYVILGAQDRFTAMEKLITWINASYQME